MSMFKEKKIVFLKKYDGIHVCEMDCWKPWVVPFITVLIIIIIAITLFKILL